MKINAENRSTLLSFLYDAVMHPGHIIPPRSGKALVDGISDGGLTYKEFNHWNGHRSIFQKWEVGGCKMGDHQHQKKFH